MNGLWMTLLAVMFLFEPEEQVDVARFREISRDADRVELNRDASAEKGEHARIISRTADFDRKEGVVLFEGDVVLRYSDNCVLCSDRLWAFTVGSNQLHRVIVSGHVSITNETRVGTCEMAIFRRMSSEVEMFGDKDGLRARLVENGEDASALEGSRIKFWLDAEQVEVEDSRITTEVKRDRKIIE